MIWGYLSGDSSSLNPRGLRPPLPEVRGVLDGLDYAVPLGWQARRDRLQNFVALRGQSVEQLLRISVAITGVAPGWSIPIDNHPPLSRVGTRRSAMR